MFGLTRERHVTAAWSENFDLREKLTRLEKERCKLRDDNKEKQLHISSLKQSLEIAGEVRDARIVELEREVRDLEGKNTRLTFDLKAALESVERANEERASAEGFLANSDGQLKDTHEKLVKAEDFIRNLIDALGNYGVFITRTEHTIDGEATNGEGE